MGGTAVTDCSAYSTVHLKKCLHVPESPDPLVCPRVSVRVQELCPTWSALVAMVMQQGMRRRWQVGVRHSRVQS